MAREGRVSRAASVPRDILLLAVGAVAFILTGAYLSMFGPSYPRFLQEFRITQASVGLIASVSFIGSTSAILTSPAWLARFGVRALLLASTALLALGALGMTVAPSWWTALTCALLAGLGAGGLTSGVNVALAARPHGSALMLNAVNAMFGLGAVLGPLLVGWAPTGGPRWPFMVVAVLALLVLPFALRLPHVPHAPAQNAPSTTSKRDVSLFALLFFLYVMTEVGAGSWLTTHLAPDVGVPRAAALTSAYWLALTVGRLLVAPFAARLQPGALVLSSVTLALLAALITNTHGLSVAGYMLLGFALAPVYPTAVAWFGQRLPPRLAPIAMTGGSLGAVSVQPLMGVLVASVGVNGIPAALAVSSAALVAVSFVIFRVTARRSVAVAEAPASVKYRPQ